MSRRLFMIALVLALAGCGDDSTSPDYDADPIADLLAETSSAHSVTLTWTAPEVDGTFADGYEIRYRAGSFADGDWDDATSIEDPPLPDLPDEVETCFIPNLPAGDTLVFRIRYTYEDWESELSNAAGTELPDAPDIPDGFAYIPAGTYYLGSPADEPGRDDDEQYRRVTLTEPLHLCMTEVTQADYVEVMGTNPSEYDEEERPVHDVSWYDAVAYCNARSALEGKTPAYDIDGETVTLVEDADGYRLPTESEWEIACRAGTDTAFCLGDSYNDGCRYDVYLALVGVYCYTDVDEDDDENEGDDEPDGPATVAGLYSNDWGLYDMHGNVYEWCWDWYRADQVSVTIDPTGPDTGTLRVIRGGCWTSPIAACRSAARSGKDPLTSNSAVGFRVALPEG